MVLHIVAKSTLEDFQKTLKKKLSSVRNLEGALQYILCPEAIAQIYYFSHFRVISSILFEYRVYSSRGEDVSRS